MIPKTKRSLNSAGEKTHPFWVRVALSWFGLLLLAFVNGALRELGLKNFLGIREPLAHQLSCLTGVILWSAFAFSAWNSLKIRSLKNAIQAGASWFIATAAFETFLLNRKLTWNEIAHTYDFSSGEFWGLALLWIGFMPIVLYGLVARRISKPTMELAREHFSVKGVGDTR